MTGKLYNRNSKSGHQAHLLASTTVILRIKTILLKFKSHLLAWYLANNVCPFHLQHTLKVLLNLITHILHNHQHNCLLYFLSATIATHGARKKNF